MKRFVGSYNGVYFSLVSCQTPSALVLIVVSATTFLSSWVLSSAQAFECNIPILEGAADAVKAYYIPENKFAGQSINVPRENVEDEIEKACRIKFDTTRPSFFCIFGRLSVMATTNFKTKKIVTKRNNSVLTRKPIFLNVVRRYGEECRGVFWSDGKGRLQIRPRQQLASIGR